MGSFPVILFFKKPKFILKKTLKTFQEGVTQQIQKEARMDVKLKDIEIQSSFLLSVTFGIMFGRHTVKFRK